MSTTTTDVLKGLNKPDGSFNRPTSSFRDVIEQGGRFEPEKGRYHLFVSLGCPWATRTLIVRKLKGLEDFIGVSVVAPHLGENGWPFAKVDPFPGADRDPFYDSDNLKQIYLRAAPNYTGRFTVPVLWDTKNETIVNNESSEIIRVFNTAFNHLLPADKAAIDLYPEELRAEIDELNGWVYETVNNGVYRSGFARSQQAYEEAVYKLFDSLDRLEKILTGKDYLVGDRLTEADVRLFVTIIRFDVAYHGAFKCNIRTIRDGYPAIDLWLRKLYWKNPAFSETCNFVHIKEGYYQLNNPHKVVPVGPIPAIRPL
ncbi:glutathione S-transferase [Lentinus brumalis]|uniref:Glutathione S-transferase n=1 Tax=Lentinus brumalis TaxID=2498619 RepID=A0A371DGV8_9APHY|nr:glutathione S-transferase [Polyporus brumalis]